MKCEQDLDLSNLQSNLIYHTVSSVQKSVAINHPYPDPRPIWNLQVGDACDKSDYSQSK
jgi:hypothetical protein